MKFIGSLKRDTSELLLLLDVNKSTIGFLKNAYQVEVEEILDEAYVLTFLIPFDDKQSELIMNDQEIVYKDCRYIITKIEDEMSSSGQKLKYVTCESCLIELLGSIHKKVEVIAVTPQEGLERILAKTNWSIGTVEVIDGLKHSMSESKQTSLWMVRQWAKITGHEVNFDTYQRKINFVSKFGKEHGLVFRYKKNLKQIKRTVIAPEATVIYPYGKGGLTIENIANTEFLENYSWYESLGIPLAEAKQLYKKEYIWEDERFIEPGVLKRAAEEKLNALSHPQISYEVSVLDLSSIISKEITIDTYQIGDYLLIDDCLFNTTIEARVVKRKIYKDEPWKNSFEFDYSIPSLKDLDSSTTSSDISSSISDAQPSLLLIKNDEKRTIDTTMKNIGNLSITAYSATNAQAGFYIIGTASQDLTLSIEFRLTGEKVGPDISHFCSAGTFVIGVPFTLTNLSNGSSFLEMFAKVDSGTVTVEENNYELFLYASNLLGGVSTEIPKANIDEYVTIPKPSIRVDSEVNITFDDLRRHMLSEIVSFYQPNMNMTTTVSVEGVEEYVPIEKTKIMVLTQSITGTNGQETADFISSINENYEVKVSSIVSSVTDDLSTYDLIVISDKGFKTYLDEISQSLRELSDKGVPILFFAPSSTTNTIEEKFGIVSGLSLKNNKLGKVIDNSTSITNDFQNEQEIELLLEVGDMINFENHSGKSIINGVNDVFTLEEAIDDFSTEERKFDFSNYGTHWEWDGSSSRLKSISRGQSTSSVTEVEVTYSQDGDLSFDWEVSSETNYDWFNFYIDDTRYIHKSGVNTGTFSQTVSQGTHTLKFEYVKDGSGNSNSDCVWIDNLKSISKVPTGEKEYLPLSIIIEPGEKDLNERQNLLKSKVSILGFVKDISNLSENGKTILTKTIRWLLDEI